MNTYKTRAQLKQEVKDLLRGRWGTGILLFLIPIIVYFVTRGWSTSMQQSIRETARTATDVSGAYFSAFQSQTWSFIPATIISILLIIINQSVYFKGLDWVRDPELNFKPFMSSFDRFKNPDWWQLILVAILISIFTFLWSLLLVIPGIIKSFAYSQTYFIYKDVTDRGEGDQHGLTDYITMSRQLMDGNKADYFVLLLSFIGWGLLGVITLGIGFIWIIPYYHLTLANYYDSLILQKPEVLDYKKN